MWINHHRMFTLIGRADDRVISITVCCSLVYIVPFQQRCGEYLRHDGQKLRGRIQRTFIFIAICYNCCGGRSSDDRLLYAQASRHAFNAFSMRTLWSLWYGIASCCVRQRNSQPLVNLALAVFFADQPPLNGRHSEQ